MGGGYCSNEGVRVVVDSRLVAGYFVCGMMAAMNDEIKKYMRKIGGRGGKATASRTDLSEIRRRGWKTRRANERRVSVPAMSDEQIRNEVSLYKASMAAQQNRYKARPVNRAKIRARKNVYDAVRRGDLKKKPCHCGSKKVEAHHKDYAEPLKVTWLCKRHHAEADKLDKRTIPTRSA